MFAFWLILLCACMWNDTQWTSQSYWESLGKPGAHWAPHTRWSLPIVCPVLPWRGQESPWPHVLHNAQENVKWWGKCSDKVCFNETSHELRRLLGQAACVGTRTLMDWVVLPFRLTGLWVRNEASNPTPRQFLCVCARARARLSLEWQRIFMLKRVEKNNRIWRLNMSPDWHQYKKLARVSHTRRWPLHRVERNKKTHSFSGGI